MGGEEEAGFGMFLFGNALFAGGAAAAAVEVTPLIVLICVTGEWPTYSFAVNLEC